MKFFLPLKPLLLLLSCPFWAFIHPFYFSLTQVDYNPSTESLEITVKLFTDDIEQALEVQGTGRLYLGSEKEATETDRYLETYLKQHLEFVVNGAKMEYQYLGKEVELDVLWVYVEIMNVPAIKSVKVRNDLLHEMFDTQQNVVQFRVGNEKRSMLLRKDMAEDKVEF
jgi:hypothetical protein